MKIVDVCAFYTPAGGGVRTYVEHKLRAGPALGAEIVILAPGEAHATREIGPGARIVTVPAPRFPLDRRYRYFADDGSVHRVLDRERPDVVEASSPWRSADMVASWRGDAARTMIMHADPLASYAYRWFGLVASRALIDRTFARYWRHLRRLDGRFDRVLTASDSLARRLRLGGLGRVAVNAMGVEPGLFSPARRDPALRAELLRRCGFGPDAALLLGVGRHAPEKRWPMVVEAAEMAGNSRPIGLVLIGDGRDRARIERQVGGNPHVVLLSPIADRAALATVMASADALVHGCESETFCMVGAEARAAGLPVIAPDEGGAADHAFPSGGIAYRAGSATAAAAAIDGLAARLPAARATAVAAARSMRTMDTHFAELFTDYRTLIRRRSPAASLSCAG